MLSVEIIERREESKRKESRMGALAMAIVPAIVVVTLVALVLTSNLSVTVFIILCGLLLLCCGYWIVKVINAVKGENAEKKGKIALLHKNIRLSYEGRETVYNPADIGKIEVFIRKGLSRLFSDSVIRIELRDGTVIEHPFRFPEQLNYNGLSELKYFAVGCRMQGIYNIEIH